MKNILGSASLLAIVAAIPAAALEFGDGHHTSGEFELEHFDSSGGGSGETLGYATADIGYQQPGGGFGAFAGFDALMLDGIDEIAFYGAVTFMGGFGKLQFGVPRPALNDYLEVPMIGGLRFVDVLLGNFSDSAITSAYLLAGTDAPLGLRYDGRFGDAKFGASYHRIDDTDVFDLAVNYQLGTTLLRAGVEHLASAGLDATALSLGAEAALGPVEAGLLLTDTGDISDQRIAKLYATYTPMDQLNLTGTMWTVDDGSNTDTLYGLAADFTLSQGAYVEAGLADGPDQDALYNLSLGVKF